MSKYRAISRSLGREPLDLPVEACGQEGPRTLLPLVVLALHRVVELREQRLGAHRKEGGRQLCRRQAGLVAYPSSSATAGSAAPCTTASVACIFAQS